MKLQPAPAYPVEDLATLRVVLLFRDQPALAHSLEFIQAVSVRLRWGTPQRGQNVASVALQAEVSTAIGLVRPVPDVPDDDSG